VPAAADDELLKKLLLERRDELEDGCVYLLKERKPKRARELFRRCGEGGRRLLYVTRQHPGHLAREFGSTVRVVWLSTTIGTDYVDPHNLNSLMTLITDFLDEDGGLRSAVLIDGVEYLMINNPPERVFKFFDFLDEAIATRPAVLLASIDARAFDPKELALLERNAIVLDGA